MYSLKTPQFMFLRIKKKKFYYQTFFHVFFFWRIENCFENSYQINPQFSLFFFLFLIFFGERNITFISFFFPYDINILLFIFIIMYKT